MDSKKPREMENVQMSVKDLRMGIKNISMELIVLDIGNPTKTKQGHEVRTVKVADETGCVDMSVWDEIGTLLKEGDIIRISRAYASAFKGYLTLYLGMKGEVCKIDEFCKIFSETPNMSLEKVKTETSGNQNVETPQQGTIPPLMPEMEKPPKRTEGRGRMHNLFRKMKRGGSNPLGMGMRYNRVPFSKK